MKLHRYVDHRRLYIVGKDRHSYLSNIYLELGRHFTVYLRSVAI